MDLKQRLEFMDMLIQLPVEGALSSLALKWYMDQFFYAKDDGEKKRLFRTNIANTHLYQVNLSHFERCLVNAADQIHEELNREPKPNIKILHRWDLKNHRDYLSHPGKGGQFNNPEMKKFMAEKRYYKEPKAVFLLNARRSLLDALAVVGSDRATKHPTTTRLNGGMAEIVHGAINYSLNDGIARPSLQEVTEVLKTFFAEYHQHIVTEADRQFAQG